MFTIRTMLVLALAALLGTAAVPCEIDATKPTVSSELQSGFSFEMIMTKLQVLEFGVMQKDLQAKEKITDLSSSVQNLMKSVELLAGIAQPMINGMLGSNYTSCSHLPFKVSGVYKIQPEKPFKEPISVFCDQEYESGGWTVVLRRFDGSVNFYRGWKEYENGFGNLDGEFWLGLDRLHQLTASKPHELVVLLEDYDGNKTYAKYDRFEIGDVGQKYLLKTLGKYSGTAGDAMNDLIGMKFTTLDSDNDTWDKNCAVSFTGAWWYTSCHRSNLNGKYLRGETKEFATGMVWQTFRGYHHSLKTAKMMIRPVST